MGAAVPDEEALAQAGAGGEEGAIAGLSWIAFRGREDLVGAKLGDAVAVGFKIVDEKDVLDAQVGREFAAVEGPGKVGEPQAAVPHGAGATEAGGRYLVGSQKVLDDDFEPRILPGPVNLVPGMFQFSIGKVIKSKINFGTAYVPRENHLSLSKNPQPSPSVAGSSAAAALSRIRVSIPLKGHISWLGRRSTSRGPVKTSLRISALSAPAIRKKTELALLMTGQVSVMRQVFICGTWLATTRRVVS